MPTITVTGTDLHDAAAWASRSTPSRAAVPVLSGLLLDADQDQLTITGYDYDTRATVTLPATVKDPGRTLLSARLLTAVAKTVARDADVTLTADGSAVHVQSGRSEWTLPTLPLEDYPALPELGVPVAHVNAAVLRTAIARVLPAAGGDDTLPMLTGVKLEGTPVALTLAATDRFRLAAAVVDWQPTGPDPALDVLVPASLLDTAVKAIRTDSDDVALSVGPGGFGVATRTHQIVGRLLDVEFVRWRAILPAADGGHRAVVGAKALAGAAEQVLAVAEHAQIDVEFGPDVVAVSAAGDDRNARTEFPPVALEGDPMRVRLNAGYLRDALTAAGTEQVVIQFNGGPSKPLLVLPEGDASYRHLVMPVRSA